MEQEDSKPTSLEKNGRNTIVTEAVPPSQKSHTMCQNGEDMVELAAVELTAAT